MMSVEYHDSANHPEVADEDVALQFASEFGVNYKTAIEMLQWLDTHGGASSSMEELRKLRDFVSDALKVLVSVQNRQTGVNEIRMSTRAMCLVLGFPLIAGARGSAELGRKCDLSKAIVSKCVNEFLANLGMERMPNQRDDEARENMKNAHLQKLKP